MLARQQRLCAGAPDSFILARCRFLSSGARKSAPELGPPSDFTALIREKIARQIRDKFYGRGRFVIIITVRWQRRQRKLVPGEQTAPSNLAPPVDNSAGERETFRKFWDALVLRRRNAACHFSGKQFNSLSVIDVI